MPAWAGLARVRRSRPVGTSFADLWLLRRAAATIPHSAWVAVRRAKSSRVSSLACERLALGLLRGARVAVIGGIVRAGCVHRNRYGLRARHAPRSWPAQAAVRLGEIYMRAIAECRVREVSSVTLLSFDFPARTTNKCQPALRGAAHLQRREWANRQRRPRVQD